MDGQQLRAIIVFPKCNLNPLVLFALTRFCLRILADENGIILQR
jgi:hypothetical protein